jgi:hypothetical protein
MVVGLVARQTIVRLIDDGGTKLSPGTAGSLH